MSSFEPAAHVPTVTYSKNDSPVPRPGAVPSPPAAPKRNRKRKLLLPANTRKINREAQQRFRLKQKVVPLLPFTRPLFYLLTRLSSRMLLYCGAFVSFQFKFID